MYIYIYIISHQGMARLGLFQDHLGFFKPLAGAMPKGLFQDQIGFSKPLAGAMVFSKTWGCDGFCLFQDF